jgi:hypothetical protein
MGRLARARKDPAVAQEHIERSLAIARQIHERRAEGDALFGLGQLAEERADFAASEQLVRESLSVGRETQSSLDIAESCFALGRLLIEQRGNREEGCALLREAVQRYTQMGMPEAQESRTTLQRLGCEQ